MFDRLSQLPDLNRNGRWRQMQLLRRSRHTHFIRQCIEYFQLMQGRVTNGHRITVKVLFTVSLKYFYFYLMSIATMILIDEKQKDMLITT